MENIASSEELKDETSKVQSDSVQYESDSSSSEPNHDEAHLSLKMTWSMRKKKKFLN